MQTAIIAFVIRRLPEKWFDYKYKAFKIFKWERKLYEAIKKELMKDEETYAKIEIKKYIRQGCEEYIERLWEE